MSVLATPKPVAADPTAPTAQETIDIALYELAEKRTPESSMLYQYLAASITGTLRTHIAAKITQKLVNGDGPTLLKYITLKMHGSANKQAVCDARASLQCLNLREF